MKDKKGVERSLFSLADKQTGQSSRGLALDWR